LYALNLLHGLFQTAINATKCQMMKRAETGIGTGMGFHHNNILYSEILSSGCGIKKAVRFEFLHV